MKKMHDAYFQVSKFQQSSSISSRQQTKSTYSQKFEIQIENLIYVPNSSRIGIQIWHFSELELNENRPRLSLRDAPWLELLTFVY